MYMARAKSREKTIYQIITEQKTPQLTQKIEQIFQVSLDLLLFLNRILHINNLKQIGYDRI